MHKPVLEGTETDWQFVRWLTYENKKKKKCAPRRYSRTSRYVRIYRPNHHFARQGYVLEHRLVWEYYNKAILLPWTEVRHKNRNKTDNRIENLEALIPHKHTKRHGRLARELPILLKNMGL